MLNWEELYNLIYNKLDCGVINFPDNADKPTIKSELIEFIDDFWKEKYKEWYNTWISEWYTSWIKCWESNF